MSQKFGRQSVFVSSLVMRLHQSGLPALSSPTPEGSPTLKSVQSVMKSLTRTEGRLLSNTLLSPVDNDNDSKDPSAREKRLLKMFVGLPNHLERKKILMSILSNVPMDRDFNFDQIVHATANYTPSDIMEVLRTAALFPLREARADVMLQMSIPPRPESSRQCQQ